MIPVKETFEMTKSKNITNAPAEANVSAIDLSKIDIGSLVDVAGETDKKEFADAEGIQVVRRIEDGIYYGDLNEPFEASQIRQHLEGYRIGLDPMVLRDDGTDTKLCRLGAEMVAAAPAIHAMYPELLRLHKEWRAAAAAKGRKLDDESLPEYVAYETAYDATFRHRYFLVRFAVWHSAPQTPRGLVYKLRADHFSRFDEAIGDDGDDWKQAAWLADMAERVADLHDPAQPVGELADLIAAHQAAQRRFGDAIDAEEEASSACRKIDLLTPTRIVAGRIVESFEVNGVDPGGELEKIVETHRRWALEYNIGHLERWVPEAAQMIRDKIAESERACLDAYQKETAPKLIELRAPYQPAIDAYHDASDAEMQALLELLAYRPRTLADVATIGAYLRDNESAADDLNAYSGTLETFLATLALAGDDRAEIDQAA